jgi:hypothetical protein
MDEYECELCGEATDWLTDPAAEFRRAGESVMAHAQCGLDAGLELA